VTADAQAVSIRLRKGVGADAERSRVEIGLLADIAHDAAECIGTVQRALRTAQHFHALEIVGQKIEHFAGATAVQTARAERCLVDVGRHRRARAGRRRDAAQGERGLARRAARVDEGQARHVADEVGKLGRVLTVELAFVDHADRHRYGLHVLAALFRGDDDRAELIALRCGLRVLRMRGRRGDDCERDRKRQRRALAATMRGHRGHDFFSSVFFSEGGGVRFGSFQVAPSRRRKLPPSTAWIFASP